MKELKADAEFWGVNMRRDLLLLLCLLIYLSLNPGQVFSQQAPQRWLLGDVISLDLENNQLTVGYIDYNTNEGKEVTFAIDAQTRYENVNKLEDIKVGDVVVIDYRICCGGKTTALNISVERLKEAKE
jgi:hypothetical protein